MSDITTAVAGDLLTKRELEALNLLKEGYPQKIVGRMMGLSNQSVKNYATIILIKLDAPNMVNAVYKATVRGMLT